MGSLNPCRTTGSHLQHGRAEERPVASAPGAGDTRSAEALSTQSSRTRPVGGQRPPQGAPPRKHPSKRPRENPSWRVGFSRRISSCRCAALVRCQMARTESQGSSETLLLEWRALHPQPVGNACWWLRGTKSPRTGASFQAMFSHDDQADGSNCGPRTLGGITGCRPWESASKPSGAA